MFAFFFVILHAKLVDQINMKRNIAIIAGGDSSEYGVSLRSAAGIDSFLNHDQYDTIIVLLRGNDWKAKVGEDEWVAIDKNDFSFTHNGIKTTFDFAYITIHGTPGENGLLQGYLDMIGLPYSCCGVLAAAMSLFPRSGGRQRPTSSWISALWCHKRGRFPPESRLRAPPGRRRTHLQEEHRGR